MSLHPIELLVSNNQEVLRPIYNKLIHTQNLDFYSVVQEIIEILELSPGPDENKSQSFKFIWKPFPDKGNFCEFLKVVSRWAMIHKFQNARLAKRQNEFLNYLRAKGNYYRFLVNKAGTGDQLIIKEVLEKIQLTYDKVSQQHFNGNIEINFRQQVLEIEYSSLKEIFKFYAVQHLFLGKSPTFQMISEQSEILDCGTFLAFCKQFSIFYEEKKQKLTKRSELTQIFKKHSTLNSFMTFKQFLQAIDSISQIFFNEENDLLALKVFNFSAEDRKVLFLEGLKIADVRTIRKKMKPLNIQTSGKPLHRRLESEQKGLNGSGFEVTRKPRNIIFRKNSSHDRLENRSGRCLSMNHRKTEGNKNLVRTQRHFSANKDGIRMGFRIFVSQPN
jgi:hypothetical protein